VVRFCPKCGAAVAPPTARRDERKLVTILFADVTGSTALGERLDPERLKETLGAFFTGMREEIEAEGGTVEKFIGDAVMAAFGVPIAHEDDPARALRAALGMQRRLDELNRGWESVGEPTLEIRIGINTGEVVAAIAPKPGEAMVSGDAVNVAARLEQSADIGRIVVAERTARATRGFRFRELGLLQLKGKAVPVRTGRGTHRRRARPARAACPDGGSGSGAGALAELVQADGPRALAASRHDLW